MKESGLVGRDTVLWESALVLDAAGWKLGQDWKDSKTPMLKDEQWCDKRQKSCRRVYLSLLCGFWARN